MSETSDNLNDAFAGESQANQRYLAFARKAQKDGFDQVAKLFRAAAAAETVHAQNHFETKGGVRKTLHNLKAAAEGEAQEFRDMYPAFIDKAKEEGNSDARQTFHYANKVEEIHHELYQKAIDAVEDGDDLPEKDIYVCTQCGNTVEDQAPQSCPICGAPQEDFMLVE